MSEKMWTKHVFEKRGVRMESLNDWHAHYNHPPSGPDLNRMIFRHKEGTPAYEKREYENKRWRFGERPQGNAVGSEGTPSPPAGEGDPAVAQQQP